MSPIAVQLAKEAVNRSFETLLDEGCLELETIGEIDVLLVDYQDSDRTRVGLVVSTTASGDERQGGDHQHKANDPDQILVHGPSF